MNTPKLRIPRVPRRRPKTPAPGSAPGTLAPVEGLPSAEITWLVYDKDICEISTLDLS